MTRGEAFAQPDPFTVMAPGFCAVSSSGLTSHLHPACVSRDRSQSCLSFFLFPNVSNKENIH